MTMNAVLQHALGVVNDLSITLPNRTIALNAAVQPNPVVSLQTPFAYVWSQHVTARQDTFPRNQGGFQVFKWQLDVYLHFTTTTNVGLRPGVDQEFPLIVAAVVRAFHDDPINVKITDPTTSEQTQLNAIGDDVKVTISPVKATEDQRTAYYVARYTTTAEEWVAN